MPKCLKSWQHSDYPSTSWGRQNLTVNPRNPCTVPKWQWYILEFRDINEPFPNSEILTKLVLEINFAPHPLLWLRGDHVHRLGNGFFQLQGTKLTNYQDWSLKKGPGQAVVWDQGLWLPRLPGDHDWGHDLVPGRSPPRWIVWKPDYTQFNT